MKKFLKENLKVVIAIVVTAILVSGITTVFAYSLMANDVSFTPRDSGWNVTNAGDALNDLRVKAGELSTNYSLNEKAVGKWVDGKTIYQKTFLNVSMGTVLVNGVDTVVNYNIYREYASDQKNLRNISDGNNDYTAILLDYNGGNIKFGRVSSSYAGGSIIHATIQYTKKVD